MVIFYSCNSPSLLTLISSYHFIHSIVPSNSFINNFVIPYLCFPSINFFWNIIYWEVPKDAGKMPRECRKKCRKNTMIFAYQPIYFITFTSTFTSFNFLVLRPILSFKINKMLFCHIWTLPKIRIGHSKLGRRSEGVTKGLSQFGPKVWGDVQ